VKKEEGKKISTVSRQYSKLELMLLLLIEVPLYQTKLLRT